MILRTFKDDLAWSQKCIKIASNVVKNLFKQIPEVFDEDEQLLIYPVEGVEGELLKQLDKGTGIDYIISNKNGDKTICFSWRAVNSTPERCRLENKQKQRLYHRRKPDIYRHLLSAYRFLCQG